MFLQHQYHKVKETDQFLLIIAPITNFILIMTNFLIFIMICLKY